MVEVISIISITFGIISGIVSGSFAIMKLVENKETKIKELHQKNLENKIDNINNDFEDIKKRMLSLENEGDLYILRKLEELEKLNK
jgi:peptidoglycan hydrolase CwlO-like protein